MNSDENQNNDNLSEEQRKKIREKEIHPREDMFEKVIKEVERRKKERKKKQ